MTFMAPPCTPQAERLHCTRAWAWRRASYSAAGARSTSTHSVTPVYFGCGAPTSVRPCFVFVKSSALHYLVLSAVMHFLWLREDLVRPLRCPGAIQGIMLHLRTHTSQGGALKGRVPRVALQRASTRSMAAWADRLTFARINSESLTTGLCQASARQCSEK